MTESNFVDGAFIGESDLQADLIENSGRQFIVGRHNKIPTEEIKCARCGGIEFNVGVGRYFTAIRCPKCKYEICIHEG